MIVCSCRKISTNQYPDEKALQERLKQKDVKCGKCLKK